MAAESSRHWNAHAERWRLVGPPLRPAASDLEYLRASVSRLLPGSRARSLLLLGVTPEIAELDWGFPVSLLAVDRSEGMVRGVWPGDTPTRRALVGDWLEVAPPEAPFDLVLGDGVFSLFDYPVGFDRLASALARLTRPGGLLSLRLFCRPERCEALEQVFDDAFGGRISNFNVFKWRLAMALQGDATRGVHLPRIWRAFVEHAGSVTAFAQRTGWPEPVVATLEGYRDVDDAYSFSSAAEVIAALAPSFELVETWQPGYDFGERCPHLSLRRRA